MKLIIIILLTLLVIYLLTRRNYSPIIDGWYETDLDPLLLIEGTNVRRFNIHDSGPYYVNELKGKSLSMIHIGNNLFQFSNGAVYKLVDGNLILNYQDDPSQSRFFYTTSCMMRKVGDPDERFYKYQRELNDYQAEFNTPLRLFDFAYNNFKAGYISAYGCKSKPIQENLNVLDLDLTQIKHSYGGMLRRDYDSLYKTMLDQGVLRSYGVKRWIYWPYPNSDLTTEQEKRMRWMVNQNRYNFLAFVPNVKDEGEHEFARFMPGESVLMRGSGTRLDGIPLRLATDGYHTGPKPAPQFMQTSEPFDVYNNWSLYTIRLPMIIDKTNDTIQNFVIPHGTYYFSDLVDLVSDEYKKGNLEIYMEFGKPLTNQVILTSKEDVILTSFFGPQGMDIEYKFKQGFIPKGTHPIDLVSDERYAGYKPHTPLKQREAKLLLDNMDKITIEAMHGPISNTMPYDKLLACINELSMAKSTEDHSVISGWGRTCESGLVEPIYDFEHLAKILKTKKFNIADYQLPVDFGNGSSDIFSPELYAFPIRATGTGHPGEYSENYTAGKNSSLKQYTNRDETRLEWIGPKGVQYYPFDLNVKGLGNIGNRQLEIAIVNYLENPRWLVKTVAPNGILGKDVPSGSTTYDFVPYVKHSSIYSTTATGESPVRDPNAVDGDWLIGTIKESKVREILKITGSKVPVVGYITHYYSDWSSNGDEEKLPWYQPQIQTMDYTASGICGASTIIREFNSLGVEHIICDIRDVIGGTAIFWLSFQQLIGGDRKSGYSIIRRIEALDSNGTDMLIDEVNLWYKRQKLGYQQAYKSLPGQCRPSDWLKAGVPKDCLWSGGKMIWFSSQTTISSPQLSFCSIKNTTPDFNGDLGNNTQFIGYGVYTRPFSTIGPRDVYTRPLSRKSTTYKSFVNWWTVGRKGTEDIPTALSPGISRHEKFRVCFTQGNTLKSLDQEFSKIHQPSIKWNMNADVFFQDIGYTIGNKGVNEISDGKPWVLPKYKEVVFKKPLTYRDTIIENAIEIIYKSK